MSLFTVAVPTGRLRGACLDLLRESGFIDDVVNGRQLLWQSSQCRVVEVKPVDVPIYVENGVADVGLVGKDILWENNYPVYELLDCKIGKCRLSFARLASKVSSPMATIATTYPRIAQNYCQEHAIQAKIVTLHGSIELAPLIGLADTILDIVDTGQTLRANGLQETECLGEVSVRLIANTVSYQVKRQMVEQWCQRLEAASAKIVNEGEEK